MRKAILLLILLVLLLQALFIVYINRGKDEDGLESLKRDPWAMPGLNEEMEVQEAKAAAPIPYPGPKATNPPLGVGVIRGRVVDLTGEPQPTVTVLADHHRDDAPALSRGARRSSRWSTETDERGFFKFQSLPGGLFTVSAYVPARHAMGEVTIEEEGAAGEILLTLTDTVSLAGRVYAPNGMALADAWVYPVDTEMRTGDVPYARFPEKTDKEGRFSFTHLCGGPWKLLVASRNHAPFLSEPIDPAAGEAELELEPGVSLLGEVVNVGDNAPEGRVDILARETEYGLETYRGRTNGRGQFDLSGLRPAEYTLWLSSNRVAPVYSPIQTTVQGEGHTELPPIWVKPAGSLRGRVILADSGERGVSDARMTVSRANQDQGEGEALEATTDQGGYYLFLGLAEGDYIITIHPPSGYAPTGARSVPITIAGGQQAKGPEFAVNRGVTVSGRVEDSDGRPSKDANVFLTMDGRTGTSMSTRTNDAGSFAFEGLSGGDSVTVQAKRLDRESAPAGPFPLNGESLTGLSLSLDTARGWATLSIR